MARLFDDASSQYLDLASTPVTAAPFTVSAWVNTDVTGTQQVAVMISDVDAGTHYWYIGNNASSQALFSVRAGGAGLNATTVNTMSNNTWHHYCGITASATDRKMRLDGDIANEGTETTSAVPASMDGIGIARRRTTAPGVYTSGSIAEVAIWDVALTDAENISLSKGVSPLLIRPASLVFYAPLQNSEDRDIIGGNALTPFNTPTVSAHPRVLYPVGQAIFPIAAAGGGGAPTLNSPPTASSTATYSGGTIPSGSILHYAGGNADSGSTTTMVDAGLVSVDDEFNLLVVENRTDVTEGVISDSVASTNTITFSGTADFTTGTDEYAIVADIDSPDIIYAEGTATVSSGTVEIDYYLYDDSAAAYSSVYTQTITGLSEADGNYTVETSVLGVLTLTEITGGVSLISDLTRNITSNIPSNIAS